MTPSELLQSAFSLVSLSVTIMLVIITARYVRITARQAFSTSFFALLSALRDSADAQEFTDAQAVHRGTAAFDRGAAEVIGTYLALSPQPASEEEQRDAVDRIVRKVLHESSRDFGAYIRSFYHLLKFIDTSGLPEQERHAYASMLRASLRTSETTLLVYEAVSKRGAGKFTDLLAKYSMLNEMRYQHDLVKSHAALLPRGVYFPHSEAQ